MCPDDANGSAPGEGAEGLKRPIWRRVLSAPEGKVLVAGVVLFFLYLCAVGLTRLRSPELFHSLWTMTTTHILAGRAAGMSWGYMHGLERWVVIVANMAIETFMVLLFYPLFVFSYHKLVIIKPLEDAMARVRNAAEAHQRTIMKFGIPGLLLFVWFPFWMTGPLVGSIIGFFIGLRLLVNLATVLAGTYLAILCWGVLLHRVQGMLERLGYYVPLVFVGFILLLAISIHIRYAFARSSGKSKD